MLAKKMSNNLMRGPLHTDLLDLVTRTSAVHPPAAPPSSTPQQHLLVCQCVTEGTGHGQPRYPRVLQPHTVRAHRLSHFINQPAGARGRGRRLKKKCWKNDATKARVREAGGMNRLEHSRALGLYH